MDNFVPLGDVLLVLKAHKVSISALDVNKGEYLLAGNGLLEVRILAALVPKMELQYLSRKFQVGIHLFWHTEMLEYKPGENPN